jgi:hypothetical protein
MSLLESIRSRPALSARKNRRPARLSSLVGIAVLVLGGVLSVVWTTGLVWLTGHVAGVW